MYMYENEKGKKINSSVFSASTTVNHDHSRVYFRFINIINHCYWQQNKCLNIKICKFVIPNYTNMNMFHPLEAVGRDSETQRQLDET